MRLDDFDALLFDMDGTLYREHAALPGAADALARLRRDGRTLACVTNNGANTSDELSLRLSKMGIDVPPALIYTACHAMVAWIKAFKVTGGGRPRVFNFAGGALPRDLNGAADFVETMRDACDIVAVGTHMRENAVPFDFERSLVGLNLLRNGAHLVVGCADRVFPIDGGGVEFGSGSWGALFAYGSNLPRERLHHVGKPERDFFSPLCERMGVRPERCLIVGDNLESDILGGQRCGMKTALLLTGITTRDHLRHSSIKPDAVFDNLPALLDAMR